MKYEYGVQWADGTVTPCKALTAARTMAKRWNSHQRSRGRAVPVRRECLPWEPVP